MMIGFFLWLIYKIHALIEYCIQSCLNTLIYICIFLTIAHYIGWIERYIWWVLENEASKILNGGIITIGSFQIDWSQILQGKVTLHASNVILHTKERQEWQWESPVVGRIGKASVECNAPICIFHDFFLRKQLPLELYTINVSDIQVFVERRDEVCNVYLFDPSWILPPPPSPPPPPKKVQTEAPQSTAEGVGNARSTSPTDEVGSSSSDQQQVAVGDENISTEQQLKQLLDASNTSSSLQTVGEENSGIIGNDSGGGLDDDEDKSDHKTKAKLLVNDMITAVETLGRAAQTGKLTSAIRQQGLELAEKFRTKEQLNQHVQVMKHVGKVAVESFSQVKPKNLVPERKTEYEDPEEIVYCRIGRVVVTQVRIFTKGSWIKMEKENVHEYSTTSRGGGWNKPIYIEKMLIRSAELCPPMSLVDDEGLPAVYQNIDKCLEVAWKRLLAEMAKSNGGRLFQTAVGEVLSFMTPKDLHPTTTKSNPTKTTNTAAAAVNFAANNNTRASTTSMTTTTKANSRGTATGDGSIHHTTKRNAKTVTIMTTTRPATTQVLSSSTATPKNTNSRVLGEVRV